MFTLNDLATFVWAFFIVLPLTSFIHAAGHAFFIWVFGGKLQLTFGRGKPLAKIGIIDIRRFYFVDAACHYDRISRDKRWKHALIYGGGILFNMLSIIIVNSLIYAEILPMHQFFYQFGYFSLYFIFFALIPIDYGENNPSDGKAIYLALIHGKTYKDFY